MSGPIVRSAFEIKRALLAKAVREGRGPEMILLLQWMNAANAHVSAKDAEKLFEFETQNHGQARTVRMLNLLSELDGSSIRYFSEEALMVLEAPSTLQ